MVIVAVVVAVIVAVVAVVAVVRVEVQATLETKPPFAEDWVPKEEGNQAEEEEDYNEYIGEPAHVKRANLFPCANRIWRVELVLCIIGLCEVICGVVFVGKKPARSEWWGARGIIALT